MIIENLRKVKNRDGSREFYIEIVDPPEYEEKPADDAIFVMTRTNYATSGFAQIENCAWIKKDRLILFKNTKKDNKIVEQLKLIDERAKKVSQAYFDMLKCQERKE